MFTHSGQARNASYHSDGMAKEKTIKMEGPMNKYRLPNHFHIADLPEYQRLMAANRGEIIKANQVAAMYSKAIDWFAIIGTIWPDFEKIDHCSIEVGYILGSDPENEKYPEELFIQIAETIAMFWKIQLENLYPNEDWSVIVHDDPEVTVVAEKSKKKR